MNERPKSFFDTKIEFLKGVGPKRAELLNTELNIFTFGDLLQHYPFRHEDRTKFHSIKELTDQLPACQLKGRLRPGMNVIGEGPKKRLSAEFSDGTGIIELVWFQGIEWQQKNLREGAEYIVYGKPQAFGSKLSIGHPDIELINEENAKGGYWQPVYNITDKLRKRFIDSRLLKGVMRGLLEQALPHFVETLPANLIDQYKLLPKAAAMWHIHLPESQQHLHHALRRLKFEELFYNQLRILKNRNTHKIEHPGQIFDKVSLVKEFYDKHLPFELTNAQTKVLKEIRNDFKTGKQMNRLLQGDVGSGKTIVAFIAMLMAIDSDAQTCIMAPTEILADQHYHGLKEFADKLNLNIDRLTGSTRKKARERLHAQLREGSLHILVGTHALIEPDVQFKNLGLCIIDEQHRFGVAQRAKLWAKNPVIPPHVLVMTATPIPRTLAMTLYGDLDLSIIDELPKGRKPIKTVHRYDQHRLAVFGFLRDELKKGRQVYIVYPLIEESEKLDLKHLVDGYESVSRAFPDVPLAVLHGKMTAGEKDYEMSRFVANETKIMVATTVIEVGVNVPNASVMVVENAERFGLSQLHQLRGRVGRGSDQSYCILMTDVKLSSDTRLRIDTMCRTNNGFEIADVDLQLRGPGDMAGTQQSGLVDLLIADLAKDGEILKAARISAQAILDTDPKFETPQNQPIKNHLSSLHEKTTNWSRIS
jgi:ATP-dependent DNA helicase RecG